jgi:hypothetical protein
MFKFLARSFVVGAFVLAAATPISAAAAGGPGPGVSGAIAISISPTVTVQNKLILSGTVTVTCPELDEYPGGPPASSFYPDGGVAVQQVFGKDISHGGLYGWTTVCDGLVHTYDLTGTAYDHPFRNGTGVANGFAGQVCGYDPVSTLFMCYQGAATQVVSFKAVH